MPPPPADSPDAGAALVRTGAVPSEPSLDAGAGASPAPWRAAQNCSAPQTTILNQPDGGVVFNNAMTSADAGFIDRTQGIIDTLIAQSSKIRCCLDQWTGERPGVEGRLMLLLEIDGAGKVSTARMDESRSSVADHSAVPCVVDVAQHTSYPPSPTGSVTLVEYPFVFIAHRR